MTPKMMMRGDRVEARYRGKSKWYKGKVTRVNSDDTYDIEYDDGDTERRVRKSLVRKIGGDSNARQKNQSMMIQKKKMILREVTALKPDTVANQSGTRAKLLV